MHIAINIQALEGGHSKRGTGVYTKQLVESLKKHEFAHTYSFFTKPSGIPKEADIVHYPFFDPFFLTLPIFKQKPTVVTVHDLIPIVYGEHFPKGIRGSLKWHIQRFSLTKAAGVITDSQNSKKDIHEIIGTPFSQIHVVYLAPQDSLSPIKDRNMLSDVYERLNLGKLSILYVGDVNWNKNIPRLIQAFDLVLKMNPEAQLLLVGKAFLNNNLHEVREINAYIDRLSIKNSVKKLGFVSEADLSALYVKATCFVLPSIAEGFGLPVLEAMKCQCPVVSARGSSLSEISGPAVSVDPMNISDIARGIIRVIHLSYSLRKKMQHDQIVWVKRFTWRRVANETLEAYRHVLRTSKHV